MSSGKGLTLKPHEKARERRASKCTGRNVSEAWAGLESNDVEADPPRIRGRQHRIGKTGESTESIPPG